MVHGIASGKGHKCMWTVFMSRRR